MTTLLAEHIRRAAHGRHRCQYCGENIEVATAYLDQRCVNDGQAYTFRCHTSCNARYWRAYRAAGWINDDEFMEWSEVLDWEHGKRAVMTDDELDADIARMINRRRNIQTLGHSWYDSHGHAGLTWVNDTERRQRDNQRQNRRRAAEREAEMCATLGVYIDDPGNAYTSPGPAEPVEGVRR